MWRHLLSNLGTLLQLAYNSNIEFIIEGLNYFRLNMFEGLLWVALITFGYSIKIRVKIVSDAAYLIRAER
jgi:hypothetical protein